MIITCPGCDEQFRVLVQPVDRSKARRPADSPITIKTIRAVLEFMKHTGPGRYKTADLHERFLTSSWGFDLQSLSLNAFSRALRMNGSTSWRTAKERGVEIPELRPDQKPAPVAPSVQAELEREGYREILQAHRGGTSGPGVPEKPIGPDVKSEAAIDRIAREARERKEAQAAADRALMIEMHQ